MEAKAFVRDAAEFFVAAHAIDSAMVDEPQFQILSPYAAYYLACHSMELAMKAVLVEAGWTEQQLRQNVGHRLTDALQHAKANGLCLTLAPQHVHLLELLDAAYKRFRYPGNAVGNLPVWGPLTEVVIKVMKSAIAAVPNSEEAIRPQALDKMTGFVDWHV
ncbi:MAG: HEPN domain-containing protein [Alphaproteobacteria bacterium]|nr:HEPN domain-containing protein [Alphaproteobacteria bacterium]